MPLTRRIFLRSRSIPSSPVTPRALAHFVASILGSVSWFVIVIDIIVAATEVGIITTIIAVVESALEITGTGSQFCLGEGQNNGEVKYSS